jgi:hypothetical protein
MTMNDDDLISRKAAKAALFPALRDMISRGKACHILDGVPAVTPRPMAEVQQRAYIDGLRGAADTVRSIRSSVPITPETVAGILDGIAAKAKVDASAKGVQTAHTPRPMKDAPRDGADAIRTQVGFGAAKGAPGSNFRLPHPPEGD